MKNGCKHWRDCFTCPFKDCIYDGGYRADRPVKKGKGRPAGSNCESGLSKIWYCHYTTEGGRKSS